VQRVGCGDGLLEGLDGSGNKVIMRGLGDFETNAEAVCADFVGGVGEFFSAFPCSECFGFLDAEGFKVVERFVGVVDVGADIENGAGGVFPDLGGEEGGEGAPGSFGAQNVAGFGGFEVRNELFNGFVPAEVHRGILM